MCPKGQCSRFSARLVDVAGCGQHPGEVRHRALDEIAFPARKTSKTRPGRRHALVTSPAEVLDPQKSRNAGAAAKTIGAIQAANSGAVRRINPGSVLALQRSAGNAAVTRLLRARRPRVNRQQTGGNTAIQRLIEDAATSLPRLRAGPLPAGETADIEEAGDTPRTVAGPPSLQRTIGDGHDLTSPRFASDGQLEAVFDGERLLRFGATGAHVTKVQQALIDFGFPLPRFGADGKFKSETKKAVENFQSASSLSVDGIVGPITMDALDKRGAGPGP